MKFGSQEFQYAFTLIGMGKKTLCQIVSKQRNNRKAKDQNISNWITTFTNLLCLLYNNSFLKGAISDSALESAMKKQK